MFTGIIKEIGVIEGVTQKGPAGRLFIRAGTLSKVAERGDSVSVDGVCLTVTDKSQDRIYFDIMKETLKATTLKLIKRFDKVNLEPSLELGEGALSGHLVSGHVDEVGRIRRVGMYGGGVAKLTIGVSQKGIPFLVRKGSVAVDGISLTVNEVGRDFFIVDIIPHTLKATTIGIKRMDDAVNLEFDIIGKYVLSNFSKFKTRAIDEEFLRENGFIS